ncbi:MAG: phage antirepressor N-terminal domain-containing protein [Chloroflexota bacterium]|nr:phage antirepressor N-terminal domain-containing protein [Chloroflexota bacterium]
MDNDELDIEQAQESQELIPTEQDTIIFNGKPLVVVRLPDGKPGVVLRWICENLHIGQKAQVERIKRTEVIADDLVYVQVQTEGGRQTMATLVLDSVPYWLATIDTRRMEKNDPKRMEILDYQHRAVAALYAWASSLKAAAVPTNLFPSEPITEPTRPTPDAAIEEWIEYHQQMAVVLAWRRDMEQWQGSIESRLEGLEAITGLIPEILERLPAPTITPEHQNRVKYFVSQLSQITGQHRGTIYRDLYIAFDVPRYQELLEAEWDRVERWFKGQFDRAKKK